MDMQRRCPRAGVVLLALWFTAAAVLRADPPTEPPPRPNPLPEPPYAIITYPTANVTSQAASVVSPCVDGIFGLVGLQPGDVVQVTIQYPTTEQLQLVSLEALDGGMILPPTVQTPDTSWIPTPMPSSTPVHAVTSEPKLPSSLSLIISVDGTLSFTFVATSVPGKNQVSMRQADEELGLQFWVLDPQEPENNPVVITANNPNPAAAG